MSVVLLGLGCAVAARGQAGVYVGYTATRISGITCFDPQGDCSSKNGVVNPSGIEAGAYYDFKTFGPVRFGIDVRGGALHSNKSASTSAGGNNLTELDHVLVGARGSIHTPISWLNPYAQISVGYGRSNATEPFSLTLNSSGTPLPRTEDSFLMYEGLVGLSVPIFPVIDLRPVELGIGNMNRVGNSGVGDGPSSVGLKSIGAAIVFHMPAK